MKKLLISIGLIAVVVIVSLVFEINRYPPITGTVIDAETGQPIAGAIVLVEWTKTHGLGEHWTESFKVEETVTDKTGKFAIPGLRKLGVDSPDMTIYKQDYVAWNNNYIFPDSRSRTDFHWKTGTIYNLNKFPATYNHGDHYSFVSIVARSAHAPEKKKRLNAALDGWERARALNE